MTRQDWLNRISDGQDAIQELGREVSRLLASGQFHLLFLAEFLNPGCWPMLPILSV